MRAVTLAIVLALVAVVAASAGPQKAVVTCDQIVTPGEPVSWRPKRVVLGVVALPPAYIRQTTPSGDPSWPYWSKAGIVVRADSPPVTVSLPTTWRRRAAIGWGNVDAASLLHFTTCPDSSSLGGWNPFTGGFQLRARAACVPLTFRVGDRTATVRFGVGKRCG
jgi:hypothetical protein